MAVTTQSTGAVQGISSTPVDTSGTTLIATPADGATKAALQGQAHQNLTLAYNGTTYDLARTPKIHKSVALTAATAETTIWTPASGKSFRWMRAVLTSGTQSVLTFKDNTSGTTILSLELAANVPFTLDLGALGILSGAADRVLTVTRATSSTLCGYVSGTEE